MLVETVNSPANLGFLDLLVRTVWSNLLAYGLLALVLTLAALAFLIIISEPDRD